MPLAPRAAAALDQAAATSAGPIPAGALLSALLDQHGGAAANAVAALGIDPAQLVRRTEDAALPTTDRAGWLRRAQQVADRADHSHVGTEHLLDALLDAAGDRWTALLQDLGTDPRTLRAQLWRASADLAPGASWQSATSWPLATVPFAQPTPPRPHTTHPTPADPTTKRADGRAAGTATRAEVDRLVEREAVVGVSVAVMVRGELVAAVGRGWADLVRRRPFGPEVASRACSVTKVVTAVAVLRLVERGLLGLDDPAAEHLRAVRLLAADGTASRATVRQLLTHTGGFGAGQGLRWYEGPVPPFAERHRDGLRAEAEPGTWRYSNEGYAALAQLVADVSGEPFATQVDRHVLRPLGMTGSTLSPWTPDAAARGHLIDRGRLHAVRDSAVLVPGAGDLVTTAPDLLELAAALSTGNLSPGKRLVLRPDTVAALAAGSVQAGGQRFRQGLGVRVRDVGGRVTVGHGGSWPGYRAELWWQPERATGVAALANTEVTGLPGLVTRLLDAL